MRPIRQSFNLAITITESTFIRDVTAEDFGEFADQMNPRSNFNFNRFSSNIIVRMSRSSRSVILLRNSLKRVHLVNNHSCN